MNLHRRLTMMFVVVLCSKYYVVCTIA